MKNKRELITDWIDENIMPHKIKSINTRYNSYRLKNIAEKELEFYVDMNLLIECMEQFDISKRQVSEINFCYAISQKFFEVHSKYKA